MSSGAKPTKGSFVPSAFVRSWMRPLTIVVFAIALFIFGAAFQRFRFFPYTELKAASERIIGTHRTDPIKILAQQYSSTAETVGLDRHIDTALLPLKISAVRLSDHFPMPMIGGALTTIGDVVLVLDRLGNVYVCSEMGGHLEQLAIPKIPNNVTEYLKTPGAVLDDKKFRAYDIKYLQRSKMLAVSFEYFDVQLRKTRLAVSVLPIDPETIRAIGSWDTVFLGDPEPNGPNEEAAGIIAEESEDKIYLSVGSYMIKKPPVSQDPNSSFGKIHEINLKTKSSRIVSLGLRNPEGLAKSDGGVWLATDQGPRGGDELNVIADGANYGWPNVSLGTDYSKYDFGQRTNVGDHSGYTPPLFSWIPSMAVSNLIQIHGFDSRWNGDILVGSLKAMSLLRLRLQEKRVLYSEPIWLGRRIRDLSQLANGTIVLWSDDTQLLFVSVDHEQLSQDLRPAAQVDRVLDAACMYCHHFGPTGVGDFAPSLSGLFSRKIGSDNYRYSPALRNLDGFWTAGKLRQFLANPTNFANGTSMPNLNLGSDKIDEIIRVLQDVDRVDHASAR